MRVIELPAGGKFAESELDPPKFLLGYAGFVIVHDNPHESWAQIEREAERIRRERKAKNNRMDAKFVD